MSTSTEQSKVMIPPPRSTGPSLRGCDLKQDCDGIEVLIVVAEVMNDWCCKKLYFMYPTYDDERANTIVVLLEEI